jgi:hypothetical protein
MHQALMLKRDGTVHPVEWMLRHVACSEASSFPLASAGGSVMGTLLGGHVDLLESGISIRNEGTMIIRTRTGLQSDTQGFPTCHPVYRM